MRIRVHMIGAVAAIVALGAGAIDVMPYAKVTGNGNDDTKVSSDSFAVEPGATYVFSCGMRHPQGDAGHGVAVMMPAGVSMYCNLNRAKCPDCS